MPDPLSQTEHIRDLEAKIEVLCHDNDQLAERGEDSLLLGLIAEQINAVSEQDQLIDVGLERISILKDIPFCACGVLDNTKLQLKNHYFANSNKMLLNSELTIGQLPTDQLTASPLLLDGGKLQQLGISFDFAKLKFRPRQILFIPSSSDQQETRIYLFASHEGDDHLSEQQPLLERIIEMLSGRLDNIILLERLNTLNQELDNKVRQRTEELSDKNHELLGEIEVRKLAQKALAAEKELLAVTLKSIGDGVITTDTEGNIVLFNHVTEKLTGWSQAEAEGHPITEVFNIVNEQSRKTCKNPVQKVLSSGKIIDLANHTALIARDGTEVCIADSGAPIINRDGEIIGVVLVFRDVTEEKQLEFERLKVKKLESLGVLAGGIAHDFNNILAAILGNISLAQMSVTSENSISPLLDEAEKASLRARDLTKQLLTFAKGGEPVKIITSIREAIQDSANFVLRGSNVKCDYFFDDELWPVEVDLNQIGQVIQNLIINARYAMTEGGTITVNCENKSAKSHHPLLVPGNYIKITIHDHGVGIPNDLIDKIFDPYFTTKQAGSGLGLAITHSIISKHDGRILVKSSPKKGTIFTVYLPARPSEVVSSAVKSNHPMPDDVTGKILIMDDDEMVRQVCKSILEKLGHEVLLAVNGEEAIAIYQKELSTDVPIDFIIMDLTIPGGMGGEIAVTEILKINPKAKVAVSSGYSTAPIVANFQKYGFCAAISKPFNFGELAIFSRKFISK